ncbi:hypothetical protein [Kitasatospora camelliae]|uniref:DUF2637 domain-containing protein n=1 Tax=Kitasatospora camelliae TaxID=3156397 RepID=A0AAU8K1M7_9ACTN
MSQPTIYSARAARQLDAVTVEIARSQAARERSEAESAAQAARLQAELNRQEALAELRSIADGENARRRERRRAERAARWTARQHALSKRAELAATVAVIVLFVVVAMPAQISFLAQRWPLPMALAGGIALETLTWVFALQGRARDARGLSAAAHHAGIWLAATVAAGINLVHGAQMWGPGFAVVAACGSLAAPITWHMYLLSQRNDHGGPEDARHERRRRRHHRKVARVADRLATALPPDVTSEQLWTLAWRSVHGADPGVTAELLEGHSKAATKVAEHLRPGDRPSLAVLERLFIPPASRLTDARAVVEAGFAVARPVAEMMPLTRRTAAYNQLTGHTPARTAAAVPARTAPVLPTVDDAAMEAKRRTARSAIRRTLAKGGTPSPTEIGRTHGMSPEWGAKQIRAVRSERLAAPSTGAAS